MSQSELLINGYLSFFAGALLATIIALLILYFANTETIKKNKENEKKYRPKIEAEEKIMKELNLVLLSKKDEVNKLKSGVSQ